MKTNNDIDILERIRKDTKLDIKFKPTKLKHIFKIEVPYFWEDGDMIQIFVNLKHNVTNIITILDLGFSLMKKSYHDDTDNSQIIKDFLNKNHLLSKNGNIFIETEINKFEVNLKDFLNLLLKIENLK
jgi:hypothetical protein